MRPIKFIFFLAIVNFYIVNGQTGHEFWFAAPDLSQQHANNSIPLYLHITAVYTTHVKISRPADPTFTPVEFDLNSQQTQSLILNNLLDVDEIEVYARNKLASNFIQNKGFLIETDPGEVTAYYEPTGNNLNTDIAALKSNNGLGTDFWVSTQRKYKNHGYTDDFSGFVVVATKDGTVVNVDPNGNNLYQHGTTAFSVTLNRGETFAVRANGQVPDQHLFGIHVTSNLNHPIAITEFDDSMEMTNSGGSWDLFMDQLVPTTLIGKEYIVLKGSVQDKTTTDVDGEAIFITAVEDNTDVYIDGVFAGNIVHAGDYFQYNVPSVALSGKIAMHVRTTKKVYVNHITGYIAAGTRELGGAVLPSIDHCTGSHDVTLKRTPAPGFYFFNNLMVRNDTVTGSPTRNKAIHNFKYSINGGPYVAINPNHFTYIMDSAFAVYDRTKAGGAAYYNNVIDGQIIRVENNIALFHLGIMQADNVHGCKYGYFSDYSSSEFAAGIGGYTMPPSNVYCDLNPIRLVANGATSYKWYTPFDAALVDKLDNDTVAAPYFFPDTSGIYYFNVIMTGVCQAKDTLQLEIIVSESALADFAFSSDVGCSPFAPILTNYSDTIIGVTQIWTIKTAASGNYQIDQDTVPRSFPLLLPANHTDSIQTHTITLVVKGVGNSCPTQKTKTVKVKPEIHAAFSADPIVGCHPLVVHFSDSSTGNLDTTSYYWDFGDYTQSFEQNPDHTFDNYTYKDTIYNVSLITESPFGCRDTAFQPINVYPRVRAAMAINSSAGCSPHNIIINPANTLGADTIHWNIDYKYGQSLIKSLNLNPLTFNHVDTSIYDGPDTLSFSLVAINRFGCTDTFPVRKVVVFPLVDAVFNIDRNEICDSMPILFTNNSYGYKLFHEWDFDDGTIRQDTINTSFNKYYFNRSDKDSVYNITLRATSAYFCVDEFDTAITVHPFIRANFGIDYDNNCAPLTANFSNLSVRAHYNTWNFGDGAPPLLDNAPTFTRVFQNNSSTKDTTYYITLVTENNEGCTDTLVRTVQLFPNVLARFNLVDSIGCSPRHVTFNNTSQGGLLSYLWEFGNNTSSTNPAATFVREFTNLSQNDTVYPIKLTVSNPFGCSDKDSSLVTVFASITSEFTLPRADSCSPFRIRPENLSSSGAKVFNWDFGPLGTSNLKDPVLPPFPNNYDDNDTIIISLVAYGVNDPMHLACADTHKARVIVYPEVDILFSLDNLADCQPLVSNITNNTLLKPVTTFQWRLDDNFYSSQKDPASLTVPNYTNSNVVHKFKGLATTNHGCTDADSVNFTVYSLVESKFTVSQPMVCSHDSVVIDRSTSKGGITSYLWEYQGEPNSNRTDAIYYKTFYNLANVPENRLIRLTVANAENCQSVWTQNLTVNPKVTAEFNFDYDSVCYPHNSQLNNASLNATNYYWSFGDGSGSSETNPIHLFENFSNEIDKSYTIWLKARSEHFCYDSITHDITIYPKPHADFYMPVTVDCPPFNVEMNNTSIPSSGLDYHWDFGGLDTSTLRDPNYTFDNEGSTILSRNIVLDITSNKGCKNQVAKSVNIYPKPVASFTFNDSTGCSPINVIFDGNVVNATQLIWYIDGNPFSTLEDPNYRFVNETADDITHDILFRVNSIYNCTDSVRHSVTVYPNPITEFIPEPYNQPYDTINDRTKVIFYNQTRFQDRWNYKWEYGDGNSDSQSNYSFDYQYGDRFWGKAENNYKIPVRLIAWNTGNEQCRDTTQHDIIINPPVPQVEIFEDLAACMPFTVDFSAFTKYNYPDQMNWFFGIPGETSNESDPVYTYTKPGVYTVRLEVTGDGGSNFDYKSITVYPQPEVNFIFNDSMAMVSSQNRPREYINFYNQTKNGDAYEWYFENNFGTSGPNSTEVHPEWSYENVGVYHVVLVATSAETCTDTMVHPIPIVVVGEGRIQFPTGFFVDPAGPRDEYVSDPDDPSRFIFRAYAQGVDEYSLEIYNRWGVLVYKTDDVNKGWNGYIDGKAAKQDVYVWRAKGKYTNGQPFHESGDVTLIIATPGQLP